VWAEPFVKLRVPLLFNLRSGPLRESPARLLLPTTTGMSDVSSCSCRRRSSSASGSRASRNFRPRQEAASFSIEEVMQKLETNSSGK